MLTPPPPAETAQNDARAERAAWRLRRLEELAEIGMEMARLARDEALERAQVRAQARAEERPEPVFRGPDPGTTFLRIDRSVRLTLALHDRFDQDQGVRDEQHRAEAAARRAAAVRPALDERIRVMARKAEVLNNIEPAIEALAAERDGGEREGERLLDALYERLEAEAQDADFCEQPLAGLIGRIREGLDLPPDPDLIEDEDWPAIDWRDEDDFGSPHLYPVDEIPRRSG